MKRANRTELYMSKLIRESKWDKFRVVVPTEKAGEIKKNMKAKVTKSLKGLTILRIIKNSSRQ